MTGGRNSSIRPLAAHREGLAPVFASCEQGHSDCELTPINRVVSEAVSSWGLPERVRRLALPSLLYQHSDLESMTMVLGEDEGQSVAVAAWEADTARNPPCGSTAIRLHGLYVTPRYQRQWLGTELLELACNWACDRGFDLITVKAWRDAEPFFRARDFHPVPSYEDDMYPRPMRREL